MVCFVSKLKPLSIQANGLQKYKSKLVKEFEYFKKLFPQLPINDKLYSKLIYIHAKNTKLDVDNMSKPFVDAFRGVIYTDDDEINHRVCTKIKLEDFQTLNLGIDSLPDEISEVFSELLEKGNEHIVYYEIDSFSEDMVCIGGRKK